MNKDTFNLTEELNKKRVEDQETTKIDRLGRVDFLNHKDQIQEAFNNGYPVKTIWSELLLKKRIKIGYKMFLIYFREYLENETKKPIAKKGEIQRDSIRKTQRTESAKNAHKTEDTIDKPKGFFYDIRPLNLEEIVG